MPRPGRTHPLPARGDRDVADYYAFFAFDPDGIRVEVFCAGSPQPGESRWALDER